MATCIITDFAQLLKQTKDTIILKPKGKYAGVELNDERAEKLIAFYIVLVMEQLNEEKEKSL